MRDIKGETRSEDFLIKSIQKRLGIFANGWVGTQTMCAIAQAVKADCFPCTLKMYGCPVIVCKDIRPLRVNRGLQANEISGTFSNLTHPVSILANDKMIYRWASCHSDMGRPETVLYRGRDMVVGAKKVKSIEELPPVAWAIGGVGLLDKFDPAEEGFRGCYSDVLRKTDHTGIGYKDGCFFLIYFPNMTGYEVNALCVNKFRFEFAIMLDGGHIAGINGEEKFAKINTRQTNTSVVMGV